jgi:hypothetical protein
VITNQLGKAARRSTATPDRCPADQAALYPVTPGAAPERPSAGRPVSRRIRHWTLAATGLGAALGLALSGLDVGLAPSVTWAVVLAVVLGCLAPLFVAAVEDGRRAGARTSTLGSP